MVTHKMQAPWAVLDAGFGRSADGAWIRGPVDSFKVWACATLFATVAHRGGDEELRAAAVGALDKFTGDVVYTAGGPGSSGHIEGAGASMQRNVLKGPDKETLRILGEKNWEAVAHGRKVEL